jgi:hypothetical protein
MLRRCGSRDGVRSGTVPGVMSSTGRWAAEIDDGLRRHGWRLVPVGALCFVLPSLGVGLAAPRLPAAAVLAVAAVVVLFEALGWVAVAGVLAGAAPWRSVRVGVRSLPRLWCCLVVVGVGFAVLATARPAALAGAVEAGRPLGAAGWWAGAAVFPVELAWAVLTAFVPVVVLAGRRGAFATSALLAVRPPRATLARLVLLACVLYPPGLLDLPEPAAAVLGGLTGAVWAVGVLITHRERERTP